MRDPQNWAEAIGIGALIGFAAVVWWPAIMLVVAGAGLFVSVQIERRRGGPS